MSKRFPLLFATVALAALAACGREQPAATGKATPVPGRNPVTTIFEVRGVIKALLPDGRTARIRHEEIPGYMPAMTMPLEVRNTNELAGLKEGDTVRFRMLVTEDDGWIDQVRKVEAVLTNAAPAAEAPPARDTFRRVREVDPLNVGDLMTDYTFTNELGAPISLAGYRGQGLAITFIYTRCPFPTFCPRMSTNFAGAALLLKGMTNAPSNWRLLSLTFDPEYDTTATLLAYAKRAGYDPQHWSLATGALIDIDAITEQFGLVFPRDGVNFNHNLRTVVIDATGRIQRILPGNEWTSAELAEELVKAAKARPDPAAK